MATFRTDVFWRAKKKKSQSVSRVLWEGHDERENVDKSMSVMVEGATLAAATTGHGCSPIDVTIAHSVLIGQSSTHTRGER